MVCMPNPWRNQFYVLFYVKWKNPLESWELLGKPEIVILLLLRRQRDVNAEPMKYYLPYYKEINMLINDMLASFVFCYLMRKRNIEMYHCRKLVWIWYCSRYEDYTCFISYINISKLQKWPRNFCKSVSFTRPYCEGSQCSSVNTIPSRVIAVVSGNSAVFL
jgi:hypothetical protein